MPVAPVDDKGTVLFYEDTGAPEGLQSYTTAVFLHGDYFNGGIFQRLSPYAHLNGIRLVRLNSRDFTGSTPYSATEEALLSSTERKDHETFFRDRAFEYTTFLQWFIQKENIPPLAEDGRTGGISIVSWSSGSCQTIPLFALADELPEELSEDLERFIRSLVLYECPYFPLGIPLPPHTDIYSPVSDSNLTNEQKGAGFAVWNSSYYTHSSTIISAFAASLQGFPSYKDLVAGLAKTPDQEPPFTISQISPEQLASISNPEGLLKSQLQIMLLDPNLKHEYTEKLLFGPRTVWRRATVEFVVNEKTMNYCIGAPWEVKRQLLERDRERQGKDVRPVNFTVLKGFNHYPHWDCPADFLKAIVHVL
ncbi:hypothetical protein ABKN59_011705 [Abortiporus biennis]